MKDSTFYRTIQIDGFSIFYKRSRSERGADAFPVARTSLFITNV